MNIFILDEDLNKSATFYMDSHIIKIPSEICQVMSTVLRVTNGKDIFLPTKEKGKFKKFNCLSGETFKKNDKGEYERDLKLAFEISHLNGPHFKWMSASLDNWIWSRTFNNILYNEKCYRYRPGHKSVELSNSLSLPNISRIGLTPFPLCMPEECKIIGSPVESYRNYYRTHKRHIAKWSGREIPEWYNQEEIINVKN